MSYGDADPKPHVHRAGSMWRCSGQVTFALGKTPVTAYRNYMAGRKKIAESMDKCAEEWRLYICTK